MQPRSHHAPIRILVYQLRSHRAPIKILVYQLRSHRAPIKILVYQLRSHHAPIRILVYQLRSHHAPVRILVYQLRSDHAPIRILVYQLRSHHAPIKTLAYQLRSFLNQCSFTHMTLAEPFPAVTRLKACLCKFIFIVMEIFHDQTARRFLLHHLHLGGPQFIPTVPSNNQRLRTITRGLCLKLINQFYFFSKHHASIYQVGCKRMVSIQNIPSITSQRR
jgi:predicted component of type VI protein secretion system